MVPLTQLEEVVGDLGVAIGVIATPAQVAQEVCDRLVAAGVSSILNFAPSVLSVPDHVEVRKVDMSIELQILAFHEQRKVAPRLGRGGEHVSVLVVGLSHRSAPVDLLERVALPAEAVTKLLADVLASDHATEAFVLSTCNRVEVYAEVDKFHGGLAEVSELLARRAGIDLDELTPHLYVHYEDRAVSHLFSVACGLDSMVVGESQVLGQVRAALRDRAGRRGRRPSARRAGPAGPAGRQAGPDRDRHRPGRPLAGHRGARGGRAGARGRWTAPRCSSSAPVR